jgi:hypothetical protein
MSGLVIWTLAALDVAAIALTLAYRRRWWGPLPLGSLTCLGVATLGLSSTGHGTATIVGTMMAPFAIGWFIVIIKAFAAYAGRADSNDGTTSRMSGPDRPATPRTTQGTDSAAVATASVSVGSMIAVTATGAASSTSGLSVSRLLLMISTGFASFLLTDRIGWRRRIDSERHADP